MTDTVNCKHCSKELDDDEISFYGDSCNECEAEGYEDGEEAGMGILVKNEVNRLAALFYQMSGRRFMPDHDFSASTHPEEYGLWNKACVAFAVIKKDNWYLKFQVN